MGCETSMGRATVGFEGPEARELLASRTEGIRHRVSETPYLASWEGWSGERERRRASPAARVGRGSVQAMRLVREMPAIEVTTTAGRVEAGISGPTGRQGFSREGLRKVRSCWGPGPGGG